MKTAANQRLRGRPSPRAAVLGGMLFALSAVAAGADPPGQPPAQTTGSAPAVGSTPPDALVRARALYNEGLYDEAIVAAGEAHAQPMSRAAAGVVLGRAGLERYRKTADPADLAKARDALRSVDATGLSPRDRADLVIGLGETLFFDEHYRSAADLFESTLDHHSLEPSAQDQVLDWWATSIDRHVRTLSPDQRAAAYDQLIARMENELRKDDASATAAYWMAAASYARGQIERAWDAAIAGWVRALVASADRGAALRPDLDRLVRDAIIPERVRRLPVAGTPEGEQAQAGMLAEWELIKERWSKR
jgi:tetratricopeptide (TPR) repeat protein